MSSEAEDDVKPVLSAARETLCRLVEESGSETEAYETDADVVAGLEAMCGTLDERCHKLDEEHDQALAIAVDLEEKNRRLASANAQLAELYAELEEKNRAVKAANSELAKANAHGAELMGHLELKNAENARLNGALSHANATAAELMADLEEKNLKLRQSMAEIRTLQGIVPICAHCKQVRDDDGYWEQVEAYLAKRSELSFSHDICPPCADKYFAEVLDDDDRKAMGLT